MSTFKVKESHVNEAKETEQIKLTTCAEKNNPQVLLATKLKIQDKIGEWQICFA